MPPERTGAGSPSHRYVDIATFYFPKSARKVRKRHRECWHIPEEFLSLKSGGR